MTAIGTGCFMPDFSGLAVKIEASKFCSDQGLTLYTPLDVVQNEIIASYMMDQVCY